MKNIVTCHNNMPRLGKNWAKLKHIMYFSWKMISSTLEQLSITNWLSRVFDYYRYYCYWIRYNTEVFSAKIHFCKFCEPIRNNEYPHNHSMISHFCHLNVILISINSMTVKINLPWSTLFWLNSNFSTFAVFIQNN